MVTMLNCDCMEYMAGCRDGEFDLAIVDPPYALGGRLQGGSSSDFIKTQKSKVSKWDSSIPDSLYFEELFRVSKNQIIWGGNYFDLPPSRCFVVWDKTIHGNSYSDCELAWTSFDKPARIFPENISQTTSEGRIHPTQKSILLYKFLLNEYAKPGDRILDTHGGSGSICIACHDLGYDLTWMELDADYYAAAVERYQTHAAQGSLFDNAALTAETAKQGEIAWN